MSAKIDRIRGSIDVPLDAEGILEAHRVGEAFAKAGGIDLIVCSDLLRARQTAKIIKSHNPEAEGPVSTSSLHPMHLGKYEGQPTKEVLEDINSLWDHPNSSAPGRAPEGTEDGESVSSFKSRALGVLNRLVDYVDSGDDKVVAVVHLRNVILAKAWMKAGMVDDVDVDSMKAAPSEKPGSIFFVDYENERLVPDPKLTAPGLYLVRHGSTKLNGN